MWMMLTGTDDVESTITLQQQLQDLFLHGGFLLRRWNSSQPHVEQAIFPGIRESRDVHPISDSEHAYTKTLGLEWDTITDAFHLTISKLPSSAIMMKKIVISDNYSKGVRRPGVVRPGYSQHEDFVTASLGRASWLG